MADAGEIMIIIIITMCDRVQGSLCFVSWRFKSSRQKKVPRLKYTYAYVEMSGFKNEARNLSKQIVAFM